MPKNFITQIFLYVTGGRLNGRESRLPTASTEQTALPTTLSTRRMSFTSSMAGLLPRASKGSNSAGLCYMAPHAGRTEWGEADVDHKACWDADRPQGDPAVSRAANR